MHHMGLWKSGRVVWSACGVDLKTGAVWIQCVDSCAGSVLGGLRVVRCRHLVAIWSIMAQVYINALLTRALIGLWADTVDVLYDFFFIMSFTSSYMLIDDCTSPKQTIRGLYRGDKRCVVLIITLFFPKRIRCFECNTENLSGFMMRGKTSTEHFTLLQFTAANKQFIFGSAFVYSLVIAQYAVPLYFESELTSFSLIFPHKLIERWKFHLFLSHVLYIELSACSNSILKLCDVYSA